mmetsp:Transcript_88971/g.249022  ORF Transcript_88971/g.249022 Transcript_88971/m.249022 type:complete len:163 (+) Transcript_88971:107-595(+)
MAAALEKIAKDEHYGGICRAMFQQSLEEKLNALALHRKWEDDEDTDDDMAARENMMLQRQEAPITLGALNLGARTCSSESCATPRPACLTAWCGNTEEEELATCTMERSTLKLAEGFAPLRRVCTPMTLGALGQSTRVATGSSGNVSSSELLRQWTPMALGC